MSCAVNKDSLTQFSH